MDSNYQPATPIAPCLRVANARTNARDNYHLLFCKLAPDRMQRPCHDPEPGMLL